MLPRLYYTATNELDVLDGGNVPVTPVQAKIYAAQHNEHTSYICKNPHVPDILADLIGSLQCV